MRCAYQAAWEEVAEDDIVLEDIMDIPNTGDGPENHPCPWMKDHCGGPLRGERRVRCKARWGYSEADLKGMERSKQKYWRDVLQRTVSGKIRLSHSMRWSFSCCPNGNADENTKVHPCKWPMIGLSWCRRCDEQKEIAILTGLLKEQEEDPSPPVLEEPDQQSQDEGGAGDDEGSGPEPPPNLRSSITE